MEPGATVPGLFIMTTSLIREVNELVGTPSYKPYNLTQTKVTIGIPQIPIVGLHNFVAWHSAPRRRLVLSMTGGGVFVSNLQTAGIIEMHILSGTRSCGQIQVMQLTGIPYPIAAVDTESSGTSSVLGTACQLVSTPHWRRSKRPGITVYTFETPRLIVSHGVRRPE